MGDDVRTSWLVLVACLFAPEAEPIGPPKEAPRKLAPKQLERIDLSGYWSCVSVYSGSEKKMETVVVMQRLTGTNDKYRVVWNNLRGDPQVGIGVLKGNTLRVGIAMDKGYPSLAEYEVTPTKLKGKWVNGGGEEGIEELEFLRKLGVR